MNKICTVCGRALVLKPGGTKKDAMGNVISSWKPFMGCSVWDDEHKRAREAFKAAKNGYKPLPQQHQTQNLPPTTNEKTIDGNLLVMEEIQALNARIDKLGEYLKSKLG